MGTVSEICSHSPSTELGIKRTDKKQKSLEFLPSFFGDPPGDRTLDPNIKSVVLYQLS